MNFLGNLFGHDDAKAAHQQVYNGSNHHKASWTHELIAGAAGFAAMQAYEHHLTSTGETPSYAVMKELLAAFAAAEVMKLIETKGLDAIDAAKAKHLAIKQAHHLAKERYGAEF
ncbi:hypothetical protein BV898_04103 [Hypsibius exemplaris]|uniref:CipC protein n=1 Tax=Hypsibius exemplaris TaxID=2072580 RepID=A0A1W0X3A6_HYPEX|nr:hypothetical protein BV898_04103 [Hypsibius exemplaris]